MPKSRRLLKKRPSFVLLAVVVALAILPAAALAKGPIEASIDGPGLGSPITIGGEGPAAMAPGAPVMDLAESAGFFPAAFGQTPDPMLARRPAGDLGPRYVIEYRIPGPNNTEDLILQDVYPYAKPAVVTYMEPGQTLFGTQATRGGWFAGGPHVARPLLDVLVEAGLPRTPPGPADGSPFPWTAVGSLAAAAGALAIGGLAIAAMRRRPRPA